MIDRIRHLPWHTIALGLLLSYPIMAIKWLPFGGGARYLSVLAGPLGLLLLLKFTKTDISMMLTSAWKAVLPFAPYVFVWTFAQIWHSYTPADLSPLTRLLWCLFLFIGARHVGVTYRHLAWAAVVGATLYGVVGIIEVFAQGRERAWGGTYENRFGEYATWLTVLVVLHFMQQPRINSLRAERMTFIFAAALALGMLAIVLSGSRGALLGLFVLIPIGIAQSKSRKYLWLLLGAALVSLVIFSALFPPFTQRLALIYREVWGYFNETEFTPSSIGIRLELYRVAINVLQEQPLLGPGYTSLQQLYASHPSLGTPRPEILAIPGFHNDWSQAIGVGGGSLLAALLASFYWLALRARNNHFLQAFIGCALIFGFSEIFFANKLGLTLLMVTWTLYSAAALNKQEL